jgi:adenylate kinase
MSAASSVPPPSPVTASGGAQLNVATKPATTSSSAEKKSKRSSKEKASSAKQSKKGEKGAEADESDDAAADANGATPTVSSTPVQLGYFSMRKLFNQIDIDADGVINKADLTEYLSRGGGDPPAGTEPSDPASTTGRTKIDRLFRVADENESGTISFSEFVRALQHTKRTITEAVYDEASSFSAAVLAAKAVHDASPDGAPVQSSAQDIGDPAVIFEEAWTNVVKRHGVANMVFPREIVLLGGAPGSGKGTNTPFIASARGISAPPLVMSSLLGEEFAEIRSKGLLVSDRVVLELLLERLLQKEYAEGVIVDGFPRTRTQVSCVDKLHKKMRQLHDDFSHVTVRGGSGSEDDRRYRFPRPRFIFVTLFIEEEESVRRQLERGRRVREHNKRLRALGSSAQVNLLPERASDHDAEVARARYRIFREHYEAVTALREFFDFTVVNATGTVDEVRRRIDAEVTFQSQAELSEGAYEALASLPTSDEVLRGARQELVARIDRYKEFHSDDFVAVIDALSQEVLPAIRLHSISGKCQVATTTPELVAKPLFVRMAMDVLVERGFTVMVREPFCTAFDESKRLIFEISWVGTFVRRSNAAKASTFTV